MRNMKEIANATRIDDRYDLTAMQLHELKKIADSGKFFEAFSTAFRFGYAMGSRATLADIKQKRMNNM